MKILLKTVFSVLFAKAFIFSVYSAEIPQQSSIAPYADGLFETLLRENNIAGAVFSMVQDTSVIYNAGYGFANVRAGTPVDPDTTLFRIASISKLFIWIGVMQMVEQGKLDLDRDINEYLETFEIPATFEQPITLRSLMTHTPGFEDRIYKLFVRDVAEKLSLSEVVARELPKRVRPPFVQASYSNHGTGIAQYIIEIVSGMPFVEYAQKYIFEPLGMRNTTLLQPLPATMAPYLSHGYAFANGRFLPRPFEYVPLQSSGGASTTAADMAKFMKALLNNTCLNGNCLLDSATFAQMTKPAFFHAEGVNPALLGFIDMSVNNRRIVGHGGNTLLFHSILAIFPNENTGMFFSFNTAGAGRLTRRVLQQFTDRFFPDTVPLTTIINLPEGYLKPFGGVFRANRFSHTELFKILARENAARISVEDDTLKMVLAGEVSRWVPIDSLLFRNINNNSTIAFSRDERGKIANLFIGNRPILAYNRNTGIWDWNWHRALMNILIVVMFYVLIVWPWMYVVRYRYVRADRAPVTLPIMSKWIAWFAAVCFLVFGLLVHFNLPPGSELMFGIPRAIEIALVFPIIAIPLILGMLWQSIRMIDAPKTRIRSRIFYWVATLVFAASIVSLHFWNLLGWNY
ncbi:MAG TPA: hypothetical protein DCM62_03110 [Bacteroidales bacterium]|nr:hypothetical protein [Bacteroidales bacterium]